LIVFLKAIYKPAEDQIKRSAQWRQEKYQEVIRAAKFGPISPHKVVGTLQVYERIMNKVDPQSLEKLFARPYCKRVWIIQEVAVASKVRILCGGDSIGMILVLLINFMENQNP
jgi:hypothetical protein